MVGNRRGGNGYGIDLADQFGRVGKSGTVVFFRQRLGAFDIIIHHGDEFCIFQLAVNLGVDLAHLAGTNDRGSEFFHLISFICVFDILVLIFNVPFYRCSSR